MASKNNWFTTNLNDRSIQNLCPFEIKIQPYDFKVGVFKEEAKRVAIELMEKYDNLYVAYSGGLDSEFVLKTFHENQLHITPILIDTPFNKEETSWAYNYCKNSNIKFELLTYSKNEIIDKLKEKTVDVGRFSLLGGIPLVICDEVNKVNGKLLTGYGDPFVNIPGQQPDFPISEELAFSEWDYYLDSYDESHPSGFLTYDIGLFYSLIQQIKQDCSTQSAKYNIYELTSRRKMYWSDEFYKIFRELKPNVQSYSNIILRKDFFAIVDSFKT